MIKLTKEKEVLKEEIEIEAGAYYFESKEATYKITVNEPDENSCIDFLMEEIVNFSNIYSLKIKDDYAYEGDSLPYSFLAFIFGKENYKEITEEEFNQQKQEVIKRLT